MHTQGITATKSFSFAKSIIALHKEFIQLYKDRVFASQFLKSGTAIGALVREAEYAQSKADFINKLSIALKEANETIYRLDLILETTYSDKETSSYNKSTINILKNDCTELIKLLTSSIKTAKSSLKK